MDGNNAFKVMDWMNARPREQDPVEIAQVQAMTRRDIHLALMMADIRRGDGLRYYSKAKRVIFNGLWINSDIYDRHINAIVTYLEGQGPQL